MAELSTSSNKIFLSINGNGKLAQKANENTPGAVKSIYDAGTPNEKVVWQTEFASIKGKITGLYYKMHEKYGESLNVVIDDEYTLQLKVGNRYYYSFVKALPNVDFAAPVRFNPWRKEVEGKFKMALYMSQFDSKDSLPWAYTKEKPNGMPEMKKVVFKGKEEWDDSDMQAFCKTLVTTRFIPLLQGPTAAPATTGSQQQQATQQNNAGQGQDAGSSNAGFASNTTGSGVDDLPF